MSSIRSRPRFNEISSLSPDEIIDRVRKLLARDNSPCVGKVVPGHCVLRIPMTDRHYWSPQLSLSVEEHEKGSLIRGLYGPSPAVWTMFMFFYGAIGFAGLITLFIGYSHWSLGKNSDVLWGVPFSLILMGLVYLAARIGRKIGHDQLKILHEFIGKALD